MEDDSLYGKNREGKVALCETCAYDGYCRDLMPWGSTLGSVGGKRHPTETKDR